VFLREGMEENNISEGRFRWMRDPEEVQISWILMAMVPIGSFVFVFLL